MLSVYYQAINDFEDAYEVIKIKTLDDYVRIYVQNDKEDQPQKLLIDLDDYFTYKIRLHTMLDRYTVAHFQRKEIVLERLSRSDPQASHARLYPQGNGHLAASAAGLIR